MSQGLRSRGDTHIRHVAVRRRPTPRVTPVTPRAAARPQRNAAATRPSRGPGRACIRTAALRVTWRATRYRYLPRYALPVRPTRYLARASRGGARPAATAGAEDSSAMDQVKCLSRWFVPAASWRRTPGPTRGRHTFGQLPGQADLRSACRWHAVVITPAAALAITSTWAMPAPSDGCPLESTAASS